MEFGELNIRSSRAFWDDYDNIDDQPIDSIKLQWKWTNNHSIEDFKYLKNFIILEGERIRNQINTANVSDIIPICSALHQKVFVYLLKDQNTAICLSEESNINSFGIAAESMAEFIDYSMEEDVNVITINILPVSAYKLGIDENLDSDLFIRGINCDIRTSVVELLEPNILSGISAAVASYRHHSNKSFSSYVIYMDSHKTHLIDSPLVMSFCKTIGIPCHVFSDNYFNESSLYT